MNALASRSELRWSFVRIALLTVPATLLLGILSGRVSSSGYGNPWFDALAKPEFMPPGWAFGAAWTVLYILLGLSLAMLIHARGARGRGPLIALFVVQLLLNYSWSPVFFGLGEIEAALAIVAAMVAITLILAVRIWPIRKVAALLLLPYLAWLCFATALTWRIMDLNPDGGPALAPPGISTDIAL